MKELIHKTLNSCRGKDRIDQWLLIEELYQNLEKNGHHHTEIFMEVQDIIISNIKTLAKEING
jgi:hypothetical protein